MNQRRCGADPRVVASVAFVSAVVALVVAAAAITLEIAQVIGQFALGTVEPIPSRRRPSATAERSKAW